MQACVVLCCFLFVVPGLLYLSLSFSTLHATEYGLRYNWITQNVDKTVYEAGLHVIGPGSSFIRFPNTYQNMQDNLITRTSDGLPVTLGVSFQYTLLKDELYDLYMGFKDSHRDVLFNVATHVIANTACKSSAYNFFNDKQSIAYAMQEALNKHTTEFLHLTVESLQIVSVHLPDSFEAAILESIAVKQNITQTRKLMDSMRVSFQTAVMAATQQANQTITLAEGRAQQILAEQTANAAALSQTVMAEAVSYAHIKEALGLNTADLIEYIWWDGMAENQGQSQFVVDMNPAIMVNNMQGRV